MTSNPFKLPRFQAGAVHRRNLHCWHHMSVSMYRPTRDRREMAFEENLRWSLGIDGPDWTMTL